jgi:hypothetical protein
MDPVTIDDCEGIIITFRACPHAALEGKLALIVTHCTWTLVMFTRIDRLEPYSPASQSEQARLQAPHALGGRSYATTAEDREAPAFRVRSAWMLHFTAVMRVDPRLGSNDERWWGVAVTMKSGWWVSCPTPR